MATEWIDGPASILLMKYRARTRPLIEVYVSVIDIIFTPAIRRLAAHFSGAYLERDPPTRRIYS